MITDLLELVRKHEEWRGRETLNLIPSENLTSPSVRSLLSSELGHRYTSRDGFYMGTRFIDEIEMYGEKLASEVFGSEAADLRPISGHVADLIFLSCFAKPGDTIVCVSPWDGGYPGIAENAAPKFVGVKVLGFPFSKEDMNIETEKAVDLILERRPRAIIFGSSLFLFPHPVRELAKIAHEVGAHVGYDGSHVLGLIAGKEFQDPLREGASVLFGSTHKSFFGPQGGIILADKEHGSVIKEQIHPAFVDNAHWNRIAALTLALAEMKAFGRAYAKQVVSNARALAEALAEAVLQVACSHLGYTSSHQVFLDYKGYKRGKMVAKRLEKANIIVDSGVRLGVCEATRRGMKNEEMRQIANFIERILKRGEKPKQVKKDVVKFAKEFQKIEYCFK